MRPTQGALREISPPVQTHLILPLFPPRVLLEMGCAEWGHSAVWCAKISSLDVCGGNLQKVTSYMQCKENPAPVLLSCQFSYVSISPPIIRRSCLQDGRGCIIAPTLWYARRKPDYVDTTSPDQKTCGEAGREDGDQFLLSPLSLPGVMCLQSMAI